MSLLMETMPDDPDALGHWLEDILVEGRLPALTAECRAVRSYLSVEPSQDLMSLLAEDRDDVLRVGLRALPAVKLYAFLKNPELLEDLVALVMEHGSAHWTARLDTPENQDSLAQIRVPVSARTQPPQEIRMRFWHRPWLVSLTTAAAVLLVVYALWPRSSEPVQPSGWNDPALLTQKGSASEYLTSLADAAEQWRDPPAESMAQLRRNLVDSREGCTQLLAAEHPQLDEENREWLLNRCRKWGRLIDWHLAQLTIDGEPGWERIRDEADETFDQLVAALRERATQLGAQKRDTI